MGCIRVNWSIDCRALNVLQKVSRHNQISISKLITNLVLQKLSDPIQMLEDERKQLAIRINELSDKIEALKNLKKETTLDYQVTAKHLDKKRD